MSETDTETTRVTDKGQTTIPKRLREKFGIEPGDEVVWTEVDGELRVSRADQSAIRGMLAPDGADEKARRQAAEQFTEQVREQREKWETDEDG